MTQARAAWKLARPLNCFITGLTVVIAAVIAGPVTNWTPVLLAAFSALLIAAASNTINDVHDIEIDRINKPQRPLPTGDITSEAAGRIALIEYLLGCSIALFIALPMVAIAILISLLTWQYALRLKRTALLGNLSISLATATAFIYGVMANGYFSEGIIPAAIAFFFHLSREIIKDMEDVPGDAAAGARTFPIAFGNQAAVYLTRIVLLLVVAVTIYPWLIENYSNIYMIIVFAGVYPVLTYAAITLRPDNQTTHYRFLSNLLKGDIFVGLIALLVR